MQLRLRSPTGLWLQKAGNSPDEYEDAFRATCPQKTGASERGLARVAVSDGASESAFAREWANTLAEAFVTRPLELCGLTEVSLKAWLFPAQEMWQAAVPWDCLPWHGEAKTRAGAFATLLGLTIGAASDDPSRLSWHALAVGDSCLFVVRDDRLWGSFPLDDASQFDNSPILICSNPDNAGELWEGVSLHSGECAAGDLFILASDALARWFLARSAAGERPWESLEVLDPSCWDAWIEEQRQDGQLGNDDTTLVILEVVHASN